LPSESRSNDYMPFSSRSASQSPSGAPADA
jgi:hypothetical protein